MNTPHSVTTVLFALLSASTAWSQAVPSPDDFRADALAFESLVNDRYAYLDRLHRERYALTPALRIEAAAVHDRDSMLSFLEHGIALLADHHAITGGSHADSWGLVPSYADLWTESDSAGWHVTDVRTGSPAQGVIGVGDRILSVDEVEIGAAVAEYWRDLGVEEPTAAQRDNAVRVLLAGRRDRARSIGFSHAGGPARTVSLMNLYAARGSLGKLPPVTATRRGAAHWLRLNDSLGDSETVAAFDAVIGGIPDGEPVVIDLTDTASGGTSTVARAIMGWFTDRPRPYQMHASPEEWRATGVARQWAEYVLPRSGKHHAGPLRVLVGRWTGSMGEGLAIGFDALGVPVCGAPMAGLLGAIEDNRLAKSGMVVKFATERLTSMSGVAREAFVPRRLDDPACGGGMSAPS